ncbi:hypothetical protein L3Q72_15020 [Vibrio sp. JC009]|uniref:hypothetical protein n=1 Tax=Vibrio sp. JC009 TaxID=2912314 RepID=UPI0023B10CC7|nr:hypothetical protein [Vibrio sp. JC009]WED24194.1 hypothetical protein L3Q72_15020 [Vibrio sp. JC009]
MRNLAPGLLLALHSSLLWAQIPGLEPEKNWDLTGYLKYMLTAAYPDSGGESYDHLIHQRFNYEYRFNSSLRLNAGLRSRYLWGDAAKSSYYRDTVGKDSGYFNLSETWSEGSDSVGVSQFDRLYINFDRDEWQFQAGRFRINWGMTTIWNPNDVFNSYSVYDFDYEERPGSDAVSVSKKLGFASQLDLVYSPDSEKELSSYGLRYLLNVSQWDVQLLGGKSGLDRYAGVGLAGDVLDAGLRAEISYFEPTRDKWQGANQQESLVASIEADYSFGGDHNLMLRGALLYISDPQQWQNAALYLNTTLSAKSLSFAEYSAYADVSFITSPLNSVTLSAIYYQDDSCYFSLSDSYSLSDDWQLLVVLQRFDGDNDSLFGESKSSLIYTQLRWNF